MIRKTLYIAYDGTEFESKKECQTYEEDLRFLAECNDQVFLFNGAGERLELDLFLFREEGAYLIIHTKTAAQQFYIWASKEKDLALPWVYYDDVCEGCWKWDDDNDSWMSLDFLSI